MNGSQDGYTAEGFTDWVRMNGMRETLICTGRSKSESIYNSVSLVIIEKNNHTITIIRQ